MLQRILTALLLMPLVIGGLFYAPPSVLLCGLSLILLGCGVEFVALIPLTVTLPKSLFLVGLFLSAFVAHLFYTLYLSVGLLAWGYLSWAIYAYPASHKHWGHPMIVGALGLLLLPLGFVSVWKLALTSMPLVLILFLIVWAADSGAYFAGKQLGRHALIRAVSPGKTIEGVLGGVLCAGIVGGLAYYEMRSLKPFFFVQLMLTVMASIIGDLSISLFKRRVHCKDTGQLLPGHGGLLDRLDSLLAAAPVFYGCFFLRLLQP